jgi:hypothetical protein
VESGWAMWRGLTYIGEDLGLVLGMAAWRRYGGWVGYGEGPHLYRGGPRVGSWALGLAHGSID